MVAAVILSQPLWSSSRLYSVECLKESLIPGLIPGSQKLKGEECSESAFP